MVVLDVGLEMLGKAVDALRKDRHLYLRRPGIADLCRIGLDHFGLAAGRYRHRAILLLSRLQSAAGPGCRPARSPQLFARANARASRAISQNPARRPQNCGALSPAGTSRSNRKSYFHALLRHIV